MTHVGPALIERIGRAAQRRVVTWEVAQGGGYTHALRLIARFDDGRSAFVKVAVDELTADWLRDEIEVYRRVNGTFLPELLGAETDDLPFLVVEDLRAGYWPPPWRAGDVERVRETLAAIHATDPPAGSRTVKEFALLSDEWQRVAQEPEPFLSLGLCSRSWLGAALPRLLEAEAAVDLSGDDFCHLDVRSDNICLLDGRTVFVDWNHACRGNGAIDLIAWLPSLHLEGGPPPDEAMPDADPALVAELAGYWAWRAPLPIIPTATRVRDIQHQQLSVALPWAARRLGLAAPDGME